MSTIYPDLAEILVSLDSEGIAIVRLHREESRNAFTSTMSESLVECYRRLDNSNDVKVVVLTGSPNAGNAFCAGADLSQGDFSSSGRAKRDGAAGQNSARNLNEHRDQGGQTSLAAFHVRKPTIAAINGHAVGIGITMTLTFDIRVAWEGAKIGFVFGQRGIVPEACSSYFLPKLIGHSRALSLLLTAAITPATSRLLSPLFTSLHPTPEDTLSAALSLASLIARANSPISMALTKALVWHPASTPEGQHLLDSKAMHVTGNGEDSKEGVKSWKEKRAPEFAGRVPKDLPTELYPWWTVENVTRSKL